MIQSKDKTNFLEVVIKIKEGRIITDLYGKPVDGRQYLHYDSCHADHIKRYIIFSQTLRLKRICSENNDRNLHVEDIQICFAKGDIPTISLKNKLKRPLGSIRVIKIIPKK